MTLEDEKSTLKAKQQTAGNASNSSSNILHGTKNFVQEKSSKGAKIVAKASNNLVSALQETSAQGAKSIKNAVAKVPTKLHASCDEKDGTSRSSEEEEKDPTKLREKLKKVVKKVNIPIPTKNVLFNQKNTDNATSETSEDISVSDRDLLQKSSARMAKSTADKGKKIWRFPAPSSNLKNDNGLRLILYRALLHDMGLICGLLILPCVGLATLINYRLVFQEGKIPTSVLWVWFLSIFVVGMEVGRIRGLRQAARVKTDEEVIDAIPPGYLLLCQNLPKLLSLLYPNDEIEIQLKFLESSPDRNVRVRSLARKSQGKLLSRKHDINDIDNRVKSGLSLQIPPEHRMGQVDVFDNPVGPDLLKAAASSANTNQNITIQPSPREIKPVFWLRGLDCFLGPPQDDLSNHDFLIARGLRNVPTFLVNVQLCFGNILLYFGLPSWFTDFDDLEKTSKTTLKNDTKDEDTLDNDGCFTKASLINFLIGSDEYRNSRLSLMSHLVDGPMPIRLLAPPAGQEMLVAQQHRGISTKWIDHPRRENLEPCLELEVDLVSSKPLRQLSLLCKRYVKTVQLDLALMLSDTASNGAVKHSVNDVNKRKEANVYLGSWRLDYIDIDTFSSLPERKTSEGVEDNVGNEINDDSKEEEGDVVEDNEENKITKAEFRLLKRDIQHASQLYTSLNNISTEGTKAY